jgi:uncharacterized protein (TIGR03437 family)
MKPIQKIFAMLVLLSPAALAQQYAISTYAGGTPCPMPALGVDATLGAGFGIAADSAGNVFFPALYSVFKLDKNGVLTRVAGNLRAGYSGDGGPATSAQLSSLWGIALDTAGDLFIADGSRIRRVSPGGIITTVAGNGTNGFSGDGGPAVDAQLNGAVAVAVDTEGNLFIADYINNRLRRVSEDGIITTVAGNGTLGYSGDGGPATDAALAQLTGVAVDGMGNLFIAGFGVVRKVSPGGIITSVAGGRGPNLGPVTGAQLQPWGLAVDRTNNLFIAEYTARRISKVSPDGAVSTVAGGGDADPTDRGPATSARLSGPSALAFDDEGNLFISDVGIRRISPTGTITTVAGNGRGLSCFSGDGGPALSAQLNGPGGVAVDSANNVFFADFGNFRIRRVSPDGIVTTVAGNGTPGFSGGGGSALAAQLSDLGSVAVDSTGTLFFMDGSRIRKVSSDGVIATVAGTGSPGYSGDGGPATKAKLLKGSLAVDNAGNVYIAAIVVRKVSREGIITTVAGDGAYCDEDYCSPLGDGGPATSAGLYAYAVVVDGLGNLLIADAGNGRLRKVSPDGIITTVAADVNASTLAADRLGNLFFLANGFGLREATTAGVVRTIVAAADGGLPGAGEPLSSVAGLAVDGTGNIYVTDSQSNAIRILRPTNRSVFIGRVVDAASQQLEPVSSGKIVVIYGVGLGPSQLVQNQSRNGQFSAEAGGTVVSFNGTPGPILYSSATQVAAIAPYALDGATARITVTYQGEESAAFALPVAFAAPGIFTSNQTGAGQAAAINAVDGRVNSAVNPVKIGGFISLYATGEGQTSPAGVDGKVMGAATSGPILAVTATVDGIPAPVQYAGSVPGQVAGLMQVNLQIPDRVRPGGYVPLILQVGDVSTTPDTLWIAVGK